MKESRLKPEGFAGIDENRARLQILPRQVARIPS